MYDDEVIETTAVAVVATASVENEIGMKRTKINVRIAVYLSAKVNPHQYNRYI